MFIKKRSRQTHQIKLGDEVCSLAYFKFPLSDASIFAAQRYFDNLLDAVSNNSVAPLDNCFPSVLESAVSSYIEAYNPKHVIVPLSAGLDSRSLLGAVLRVFPDVICRTYGEPNNQDRAGATSVCRSLGLHHDIYDPSYYEWKIDKVVAHCAETFRTGENYKGFNTCFTAEIYRPYDECITLSGYLGDMLSGGHLMHAHGGGGGVDSSVNGFLKSNAQMGLPMSPHKEIVDCMKDFCEVNFISARKAGLTSITRYDVLDIALRQGLRIGPGLAGCRGGIVAPHSHPSLIYWWLNQSVEDRLGQKRYRKEINAAYPEVFCLSRDRMGGEKSAYLMKVIRRVAKLSGISKSDSNRGDPRTSPSKLKLVEDCIHSLAARGLPLPLDYDFYIQKYRSQGNSAAEALANVEVHLRAGNIRE